MLWVGVSNLNLMIRETVIPKLDCLNHTVPAFMDVNVRLFSLNNVLSCTFSIMI